MPGFEATNALRLLPGFAKDLEYGVRTYNARSETVASLVSFKNALAKARHCIVPCEAIFESDWRTRTHVPTRFTAVNDQALGVAGIWSPWKSPAGESVSSFAMLTLNADNHEIFRHYHRPDPARPPGWHFEDPEWEEMCRSNLADGAWRASCAHRRRNLWAGSLGGRQIG